jgi:hypothetical protein
VQVLLEVLRRAKAGKDHMPLSIAYTTNDKLHSQPFPLLFARPLGTRHEVLGRHYAAGSCASTPPSWAASTR